MPATRLLALLATVAVVACTPWSPERRLSRTALEDKVRGGWAGQMIGVAYGGPTEFQWNGRIVEGEIDWSPEMIENTIEQHPPYHGSGRCGRAFKGRLDPDPVRDCLQKTRRVAHSLPSGSGVGLGPSTANPSIPRG